MKTFAICIGMTIAVLSGVAACTEKSGEAADSAIENATQGRENRGDGPLERAGEAADRATGNERRDNPADAIHDATDGDRSTRPN